jgi:hypothetical protein
MTGPNGLPLTAASFDPLVRLFDSDLVRCDPAPRRRRLRTWGWLVVASSVMGRCRQDVDLLLEGITKVG